MFVSKAELDATLEQVRKKSASPTVLTTNHDVVNYEQEPNKYYGVIYALVFTDGNVYVGQSINFWGGREGRNNYGRWFNHLSALQQRTKIIHNSKIHKLYDHWRELDYVSLHMLCYANNKADLNALEAMFIIELDAVNKGFNVDYGNVSQSHFYPTSQVRQQFGELLACPKGTMLLENLSFLRRAT